MDEAAVRGHDGKTGNNFVIQNYANLTLENVSVKGNSYTSYVVSINSGKVALTGNTSIEGNNVAFDVCKYLSYEAPTVTVNTTGTITGKVEVSGGALDLQAATINGELVYISGSAKKADTVALDAPEGYKWVEGVLTAKNYVASIGSTNYATLAEAIKAAEDMNTEETVVIELHESVSGVCLTITKNIKIVFLNGCSYTANATEESSVAVTIAEKATLTLEGGTLATRKRDRANFAAVILNKGTLNTSNMILKGYFNEGDDVESCVIDNQGGAVNFAGTITISVNGGAKATRIKLNGGTVTKESTVKVTAPTGYCWNAAGTDLGAHNPTGATCLTAATCAHCGKTEGKVQAHIDSDNDGDHICDTDGCDKVITKHEYADDFATECRECGAVRTNAKDVVAMIGTEKFATLAEAVKAANAMNTEETVVIDLQMSARGEALTITKNITINFNGKTYTVSETDGPSAAVTIEDGVTLTLIGGTLGSRVEAGQEEKFDTLILNKGTLNANNMTLRGNYLGLNQGVKGGAAYTVYNDGGSYKLVGTKIGQNTNCENCYKIYPAE